MKMMRKLRSQLDDDTSVSGTYDIVIDGAVDDIKSASNWSYTNKFESFDTLRQGDAFGYVAQLAGYAKAADKRAGGWWVVNKANGEFKYVPATGIDIDKEVDHIQQTADTLKENKFERCFDAVPEKFRGKETGNMVLDQNCGFCRYRFACWPGLEERPAVASQAKQPKTVAYVSLAEEYKNDDVYDIETLAEEIKATERKLSDLRQEYRERKTAGLRAALEARKEADRMIREEMKGLDHQSCYITWRSVGSLA